MSSQTSINPFGPVEVFPGLVLSPSGGKTFYVHASGASGLDDLPSGMAGASDGFFQTTNAALNACRANRGDRILWLPGHTETVSTADFWSNIKAGVRMRALGPGSDRATFTWSTATSTILLSAANVVIENAILKMEPTTGAVTVAAPITVSAVFCAIRNCKINCGTDSSNKVTIGITTTAAADDFFFEDNQVYGAAAATMTTFLRLVGVDRAYIRRNYINCGTTAAAVGPIQVLTTACTELLITDNYVQNNATSSTACITAAVASTTGVISDNRLRNMTDASVAWIVVTSGDVQLFQNYGVNNSNETGILAGTASV